MQNLATRAGVSPSKINLPKGHWRTCFEFLIAQFPHISADIWRLRIVSKNVLDAEGKPIDMMRPYEAYGSLYYYRELPFERKIPFDAQIVFHNEHILVVDKPHFLPTIPSGQYVQESLLVRLKQQLGLDNLAPLHRLDKETAGLVMFSCQAQTRARYHALFSMCQIQKTYEAIAPFREGLNFPIHRSSCIVRGEPFFLSQEISGVSNSHTTIELLKHNRDWAQYRLTPKTGKKHQLRLHMASLGLAIKNDHWYPVLQKMPAAEDYQNPLQLLAQALAFEDPMTQEKYHFQSLQKLVLV